MSVLLYLYVGVFVGVFVFVCVCVCLCVCMCARVFVSACAPAVVYVCPACDCVFGYCYVWFDRLFGRFLVCLFVR